MTSPRSRTTARIAALSAATLLGLGTLGCGYVQNAIDTANTLSEFSDRLGKATQLTYTAEYTFTDQAGSTGPAKVTLVQQPPNTAFISGSSRMIVTAEHLTMCEKREGRVECQRSANPAGAVTDTGLVSGVAGPGFVTPELALGLVAAAAMLPGTDVATSERKIAGQDSLCADVTGIQAPPEEGPNQEMLQDFSVCVTEAGVLASFSGTANTGDKVAIVLASFSEKASPKAFAPPAGAKVVDVTAIAQ
ncbi:MAG TPA: hypothetical protein VFR67_12225 [Pilimelia sp.]|nr:hypothetical protein [Pilimelia sp.]